MLYAIVDAINLEMFSTAAIVDAILFNYIYRPISVWYYCKKSVVHGLF